MPAVLHAAVVSVDQLGRQIDLEAVPSFSTVAGDGRIVLGFPRDGGTDLSILDFEGVRQFEAGQLRVGFMIDDGAVDPTGKRLIVVGHKDGATKLAAIDLAAGTVKEGTVPITMTHPIVALDAQGTIHVADQGLDRIAVLGNSAIDGRPEEIVRTVYFDAARGVGSLFVTAGGQYVFVGDRARPRLSAIDESGRVRDTLSILPPPNPNLPTVPATISFHDGADGVAAPASLLVADYNSETLQVVDFEPVLQTMSVAATSSIAVPIQPGTFVEPASIGGAALSPAVLGASPDQGTIVVGNSFSTRLLFFSRRDRVIERTGSAELAYPPVRILVSPSGRDIVVLHADAAFMTSLNLGSPNESSPVGFSKLAPGGAEDVREVQRLLGELGYPVGTVDGYVGPRTVRSLQAVGRKSGVSLDIERPAQAVEALQRIRKGQ